MEGPWLESPTKVKKDKKDRRRQPRLTSTTAAHVPSATPKPKSSVTVTPEKNKQELTGFWSLRDNDSKIIEPPPEPPSPTSEDNNWDISMTEDTATKTGDVREYMVLKNTRALEPNSSPTKRDLIHFKLNLTEALAKCQGSAGLVGGHIYLILTEPEYRNWIGDQQADLPKKPMVPRLPTEIHEITSAIVYVIKRAETALTLHNEYEQQVKDILETKFPNGTIGLRDPTGKVPYGTTAITILNNITNTLKDDMEENQLYREVVQGIMSTKYTPGKAGAAIYFQSIEDDQHLLQELGYTPLPNSLLIPQAQGAFQEEHDLKDITKIALKWKELAMDSRHNIETPKYWDTFKDHYKHELKLLYMQVVDKRSKGKARYTADTVWRDNIQDELDATREELDTVSVALRTVLNEQASLTKQSTTPTTVTVPTAAMSTVGSALTSGTIQTQGLEQLTAALVAALQNTNGNQCQPPRLQGQTKNRAKTEQPWRQWNQYCWSCGVQLNHNSATCKHPRQGHDNHLSATYEDQQGGNTKRNHLWGKWCGPDINIYNDKGDTTKWTRPKDNN